MRLLPGRTDHAGGGLAGDEQEPIGGRNPQRHERQYLPLRLLSAHHRRHQGGSHGGMTMTSLYLAIENVSRRGFLRGMLATGGLVVAAEFLPARVALAYATGAAKFTGGVVSDPHVFVSIDPSGIVTIIATRSEMGTGSRTSLPMVVADELDADWSRVKVRQAPGDETKYGNQDTDGSRSLRHFIQPMREVGAAMRLMLEMAAAKQWGVDVRQVQASHHEVLDKMSNRKLGYGALAADAAALPTPPRDKLTFKDASQYRYIGKGNVGIVDLFRSEE